MVVPTADIGLDVIDYATAFAVTVYPTNGGLVTMPLGEDSVIVEATAPPAIPTVSEWEMIVMALLLFAAATPVFRALRRPEAIGQPSCIVGYEQ